KYVVSIEIGRSWSKPVVLGHALVELEAGQKSSVTITLADPPKVGDDVPLEGTLYVPPAWGAVMPSIAFDILGRPDLESNHQRSVDFSPMQPVPGSPGRYRWNAGLVPPGRYAALLHEFALARIIEVPPEGQHHAEIVVGEPADVRVQVLDAETGLELELQSV